MHILASCFPGLATTADIQHSSTSPYEKKSKKPNDSILGCMQLSKDHVESGLMLAAVMFYGLLKDPFPMSLNMG